MEKNKNFHEDVRTSYFFKIIKLVLSINLCMMLVGIIIYLLLIMFPDWF